jgi:hypothetical protein
LESLPLKVLDVGVQAEDVEHADVPHGFDLLVRQTHSNVSLVGKEVSVAGDQTLKLLPHDAGCSLACGSVRNGIFGQGSGEQVDVGHADVQGSELVPVLLGDILRSVVPAGDIVLGAKISVEEPT